MVNKWKIRLGEREEVCFRHSFRLPDDLPCFQMPADILADRIKVMNEKNGQKAEEQNKNEPLEMLDHFICWTAWGLLEMFGRFAYSICWNCL